MDFCCGIKHLDYRKVAIFKTDKLILSISRKTVYLEAGLILPVSLIYDSMKENSVESILRRVTLHVDNILKYVTVHVERILKF
jgi:hypothetical protein